MFNRLLNYYPKIMDIDHIWNPSKCTVEELTKLFNQYIPEELNMTINKDPKKSTYTNCDKIKKLEETITVILKHNRCLIRVCGKCVKILKRDRLI